MFKRTLILLPTVLLLISSISFAQNTQVWPKTFLWRISGNGLTKDSYLYGTMHLQDKRLFNFGDSLYRYLEKAEGYALEIDLTEMMDTLFQRIIDEKIKSGAEERQIGNSRDKKKYIDSLINNLKKSKDKESRKILQNLRNDKMNSVLKKEMPTMMDAFLYGLARRQGKWLGGIEDLQDQLPILDELGRDITTDELLGSDKEIKSSLEKMIAMYVSRDLDKIESLYLKDRSEEFEDISLIRRNIKMASRMDSLAHVRSMFFTVGVAHLPGDSGVITLLRKKGFRLDPVFSTNEVDPIQYASTLKSVDWERTADANNTYEIEMPGKAAEVSIASGMVKMKYFVDLSTLTFFMTTSSVVAQNTDLESLVEKVTKAQNAIILSKKKTELKGAKGIETNIYTNQNYFKNLYLIKGNILYMIFVGGQRKETTNNSDADHFIGSFTPSKEIPVAPAKTWKRFSLDEKGCSILFPGDPRKNPKMAQGIIDSWKFSTYDLADPTTGTYFLLQTRDIDPGLHLTADSSIFLAFRERISKSIKTVTLDKESTLNGYPILKYEGIEENGVIFKSVIINRGNRCYYIIVEGQNTTAAVADMNNFLDSFIILDYEYKDWQKQLPTTGNFQTLAPASFILKIDTASTVAEKDKPIHFVSYDTVDCTSYEVLKYKLSPYYYAADDSTLFHDIATDYRKSTDSVLSEKWVTNGNLKGQEWISQTPGNNNIRKARVFVSGDTVYYILCYLPSQKINEQPYQQFFTDFKIIKEESKAGVHKRKIERILNDLQSSDSVIFSEASEAFLKAKLIPSDKPLLEEALLKEYQDDASNGTNTRDRIVDTLLRLMDNSSLNFIRSKYPELTGTREFIKLNLLNLLVNYKTQDSYNLLKELLISNPPKNAGEYMLAYRITDSLELARSLFPDLLQLSNNPIMTLRVMEITSVMLEKKLIPVSMLDQYRNTFIHTADTLFFRLSTLDYIPRAYLITDMLNLMQQLKDAEGNRILNKYIGLDNLDIKQNAIENLLKNGLPVDSKEVEKVAADKSYRKYFYEQLHKIGKTAVFPALYNTQQSIAESDLYNSIDEDYAPTEIKSLGVKTVKYKGKSCKIYLFRVMYEEEDDSGKPVKDFYLGMSGPFSMDSKDLITESDLTNTFFDEEYDPKKTQKWIEDYIKSMESEKTEEK